MPEGDTVHRTARMLDRALSGRVLDRADFRVPALATVDLAGATVDAAVSRGKHLLIRIQALERCWTLHSHLMMDGRWRVLAMGGRWPQPAHEARVVLVSGDVQAVGFLLQEVDLVGTHEEHRVVGHLGPDLLGADWNENEARTRLLEQPDRTIGDALLDQTRLAGIGNVYRAELCFVAGVHPRTPVGQVTHLPRLVRLARQMLEHNARRSRRATTGDLRNPLWVHGRAGSPCRRCGTTVRSEELGAAGWERTSYWCPRCQPQA